MQTTIYRMDRQQGSTLQHRELNQYTMINLYHDFEQNTMILFILDFRYTMTYIASYTKYILFHILCYTLFQQNTRFSIYYDKPLSQYIEYVPCAIQQNLVYPFYMQQFASAYSKLPILPSFTSLPLGNHNSILYVCEYASVSQTHQFVSYFRFHMYDIIWCQSFSS